MDRQQIIQKIFEGLGTMRRIFVGSSLENATPGCPTRAQIGVLFIVQQYGPRSIKEIASQFGMTSSAATQLVNSLVKEGLLSRTESAGDRRKTCIALTPKGKKDMVLVKKNRYAALSNILEVLSTEELIQLQNIQEKIHNRMQNVWTKNQNK